MQDARSTQLKQQCNVFKKIWCRKKSESQSYEWFYCKQRNDKCENI